MLSLVTIGECITADTDCDVVKVTRCIPTGLTGNLDGYEQVCGSNGVTYGTSITYNMFSD